jgi:hypothetical protein
MKKFLVWGGIVLVLLGCEGTRSYEEGNVYVVNNVGSRSNLPFHPTGTNLADLYVIVIWEGEWIRIQPNMDDDKNSTGVGAVQITSGHLPGAMRCRGNFPMYCRRRRL